MIITFDLITAEKRARNARAIRIYNQIITVCTVAIWHIIAAMVVAAL